MTGREKHERIKIGKICFRLMKLLYFLKQNSQVGQDRAGKIKTGKKIFFLNWKINTYFKNRRA